MYIKRTKKRPPAQNAGVYVRTWLQQPELRVTKNMRLVLPAARGTWETIRFVRSVLLDEMWAFYTSVNILAGGELFGRCY